MSNIDRSITNEAVIPVFETDLFEGHEASRFAIGIIAVGDEIAEGREEEFSAYLRLRAKVYADQTQMIKKDQVRADGTEMDADDARSVHFGIFEQHELGARAVGSIRLIVKSEEDNRPLPIEEFFPDAFSGSETDYDHFEIASGEVPEAVPGHSAPVGSAEASRLIARHESAAVQRNIKWTAFAGALAFIREHKIGPTYATVEPTVESDFAACRMRTTRIAEPVYVEEYQADNLGVIIDTADFMEVVDTVQPGMLDVLAANEGSFTYYGRQVVRPAPIPAAVPGPRQPVEAAA